jgi:hypothetical protein
MNQQVSNPLARHQMTVFFVGGGEEMRRGHMQASELGVWKKRGFLLGMYLVGITTQGMGLGCIS